ncbi:putative membrane protein [Clostridium tetanomorphum]|uniref:YhgE/Pip domain-containing protein n=1 Tax=Clostridium tetanomorphum TaxID=1553 RepID=A0A923J2F9_CLOTT|nr:YhgE/Pip domain-containing protein [Clostridium tetanomorphum]KAJ51921.1 phage infection protein [Clostridium tetanomorphum DSM 665]MBC2398650.1 YhgE/Pip domain-containing protein [Clostridium tetanomorphum]MBP1864071.1 putative membrane protein [Clostridium tetanomorphum]NRS84484.1 putative membrane protein [Clostridium tetanomorphum]NRZ97698.1 putative membrane protein [Clostridium tetanomorphum]
MQNTLKVFKRDIKSILKNPVAMLVVIGICFIPSLYAWVNIKACWDPYENTSTIPIAVVNNDKGATFNDKELNIGNDVIKKLKDNHKIGWKFVNSKQAELGVVDGTYYATIEIPENFSKDLTSLVSDKPKKPEIVYKVDTKTNPVATKIAGAAKTTLIDEITTNFISTVNETVFDSFNDMGEDLHEQEKRIIRVKDSIIKADKNMEFILATLNNVNSNSTNLSKYLSEIKTTMPDIAKGIKVIGENKQNNKNFLINTKDTLNSAFDNVDFTFKQVQSSTERIQDLLQQLAISGSENTAVDINDILSKISTEINSVNNRINRLTVFLENINDLHPNKTVSKVMVSLKDIMENLDKQKIALDKLQKQVRETNKVNQELINTIMSNINNIHKDITSEINDYNVQARPQLNNIVGNLIKATDDASKLIDLSQGLTTEIDKLLGSGAEGAELASQISEKLYDRLTEYKDIISKISDKLNTVDNKDLVKIISILQSNPEFMGDFISNPFNLKEQPIYKIPNYGSAMTPVYTVLALWVGGLILTSVLRIDVVDFEGSQNITIRQKYFGKMLTFITLALVQGLVVSIGNKVILGVYTVNTFLMILFALITSLTFSIIIYTCVALLGNIGKALAIVLMIVQLAGSGGTYPIQVDPMIFRVLQPFFPFTYAVGGFREAIAGPLVSSVVLDLLVLIVMAVIFIVIGYFLKSPLHHKVNKFEAKFKASGISE